MGEYFKCTHCKAPFYREDGENWKTLCLPCWKRHKAPQADSRAEWQAPPPPRIIYVDRPTPIEPEMLRRLLQLCHPDKHGGSDTSTVATQWLLNQRRVQ